MSEYCERHIRELRAGKPLENIMCPVCAEEKIERLQAENLALTETINGLRLPAVDFDGYPIETAIERLQSQYNELARVVWALPPDEPLTTTHEENVAEAIRDTLRAAAAAKEEGL